MTLPEIAIRRPVTVGMILVSLIVLGSIALVRLPLAFLPEQEEPEIFVMVPYPNATPQQVERMIVRPLEEALGTIPGLKSMWSMCNGEGGRVRLDFDWGTDMSLIRVEVRERVDRIRRDLPEDIDQIFVSKSWDARDAESPILEGRLASARDLSESYDLLDRKIVKPLERIPGVAQVRLDGVNPKEVRVNLRLADLESHRIDIRTVSQLLADSNFDQSLGEVTEPGTNYRLRTIGTFTDIRQIQDLVLRPDGLKLSDIADVVYEEPELEYGRHLDGQFAIGITVNQESNANTVTVCDEVKRRVEAMGADPELEGVNFLIWFNQGKEIKNTLRDLLFTGIFGAILASLVLYLFLRRFSATSIAVSCIPFSLVVACGWIWAQGKTMNTITLLGLIVGIGMLVDNAVVVMENIFRHQERGLPRKEAALLGSREVSTAVVAATLTSVIVFLPMIFNRPSEMNLILRELGITVCLTLLASLFVSQTLIPLATAHFISARPKPKTWPLGKLLDRFMSRTIARLEKRYLRTLSFNLRHRWITPLVGFGVTATAVIPFMKIDKNFDANETEAFVGIRYEVSESLSLERKEQLVSMVESQLMPHKDDLSLRSIYSFWSDRWVMSRLYLDEGKATEAEIARVRREVRGYLPELPGVKLEVMDAGPHWRRDRGKRVAFQITGEDSEVLAELAAEAKDRIGMIPGLSDPFSGLEGGNEELVVSVDRDLASRYGVNARQPSEVVQLTYRGRQLPRFRTPEGERPMRLTLDETKDESVSQLRNLPIYTSDGARVPLASLADFEYKKGAEAVHRDDRVTSVWVGARYEEGTREQYIPLVQDALSKIDFPYGYDWSFSKGRERRAEQSREFLVNLLLALLLIFAVMAGLFESVGQAAALLIALPFAVSGACWTLWLSKCDLDQPAAVGLLLLIGIVVNNGIVMLEHINLYRRAGVRRTRAILQGGRERLRPIVMTALTTLIGLIPIVVQKPALAGVYYYSMALVIMGGLVVSTVLTLVLLPTTAILIEDTPLALRRLGRWIGRTSARRRRPIEAT